jgi:hypothetical protein
LLELENLAKGFQIGPAPRPAPRAVFWGQLISFGLMYVSVTTTLVLPHDKEGRGFYRSISDRSAAWLREIVKSAIRHRWNQAKVVRLRPGCHYVFVVRRITLAFNAQ